MKLDASEIEINGVKYVPKSSQDAQVMAKNTDGLSYVIIRSQSAGVFAGYLSKRTGDEAVLLESRRIFYWTGAATLSQLAIDGTSIPTKCQFPEAISSHTILQVIEVIPVTEKAKKSIESVKVWKV
jgi:hypothetical protein